jgi:hypothetical protein
MEALLFNIGSAIFLTKILMLFPCNNHGRSTYYLYSPRFYIKYELCSLWRIFCFHCQARLLQRSFISTIEKILQISICVDTLLPTDNITYKVNSVSFQTNICFHRHWLQSSFLPKKIVYPSNPTNICFYHHCFRGRTNFSSK